MKKIVVAVLWAIGKILLVDAGIFALVSLSCLIGARCTGIVWGERLFWAGLFMLLVGGGTAMAVFGSGQRPNYRAGTYDPFETDEEEVKYRRRRDFVWQAGLMGLGVILIGVLVDTLARR